MNTKEHNFSNTRQPELDALKGILIFLIVLGHNYYFSRYFPVGFNVLYNFHVACFLLFPFLFIGDRQRTSNVKDRLIRILVPHYIFFALAIVVYFFVVLEHGVEEIRAWTWSVLLSLVVANETFFEQATGLRYFWFLPAFSVVTASLFVYEKLRTSALVIGFIVFFLFWHILIGFLDPVLARYIPWGGALAGFLMVPGMLVHLLWKQINWRLTYDVALLSVWILLLWSTVKFQMYVAFAGETTLPTISTPVHLLFHDALLIVSFFALYRLGWWLRRTVFRTIGQYSLQIFLLHPFIWQIFWRSGGMQIDASGIKAQVVIVVVSVVATIGVAFIAARLFNMLEVRRIVFPRYFEQWFVDLKSLVAAR